MGTPGGWQSGVGYYRQLFAAPRGGSETVATLSGIAVFGDPRRFAASLFTGVAGDEDAALGLTPGTTVYDPARPPGGAILCTGYITGTSVGAVAAAQAQLAGYAGGPGGDLIAPTGIGNAGWDLWHSCWFAAGDLAWSAAGIVPSVALGAGRYEIGYSVIFRRCGPPGN